MDEKNQLTILIQNLKREIDKIEKEIQRNEMDAQVWRYDQQILYNILIEHSDKSFHKFFN